MKIRGHHFAPVQATAGSLLRLLAAVVPLGLAGCAGAPAPEASQALRIPNPAAVACVKAGGKSVIVRNPDGSERGDCILPSGTVCDQWAFFRSECGP